MSDTVYIYSKFLGIHSFIDTLTRSDTEFRLFDEDYSYIFNKHGEILQKEDTIKTGLLTRDGQNVYFIELGIKITKSYTSYFLYIFDHHPDQADIDEVVAGLESLVSKNLDNVDMSDILQNLGGNEKKGHMIN